MFISFVKGVEVWDLFSTIFLFAVELMLKLGREFYVLTARFQYRLTITSPYERFKSF